MIESSILTCLRSQWQPGALEMARTAAHSEGFGRAGLLDTAHDGNLAPLLYAILRDQGIVPGAVEQELRRARDSTALRNTFLFHRAVAPSLRAPGAASSR